MDWGKKKPVALKIWRSLRKGYVLNINTTRYVYVCVFVYVCGYQPLFEVLHSTLAITSYQGLDEGEGKEERERWKDARTEEGGSGFGKRTEMREKPRGEKRLRSLLQ